LINGDGGGCAFACSLCVDPYLVDPTALLDLLPLGSTGFVEDQWLS